jgi:hypothetical protein
MSKEKLSECPLLNSPPLSISEFWLLVFIGFLPNCAVIYLRPNENTGGGIQ